MNTNEIATYHHLLEIEQRISNKILELDGKLSKTENPKIEKLFKSKDVRRILANMSENKLKALRDKRLLGYSNLDGFNVYSYEDVREYIKRNYVPVKQH